MPEDIRKIAHRRGYMAISVRNRGAIGRNRRKAHRATAKESWAETGKFFHTNLRDKRFTPEHALQANYARRRGQNISPSAKGFGRQYYGRKYLSRSLGGGINRADPLVKSGDSRRNARVARITSSSNRGRVTYPGLRKLNRRHKDSRIRMNEEFRRFTAREIPRLADVFDDAYDTIYNRNDRR